MMVRAAVLSAPGARPEIVDVELDDPRTGEVEVAITAAGVCGSDLHVVAGDWEVPMPVVLGHEGAGVVTRIGPDVDDLAPGDHVVLSWVPQCGRCRQCEAGRPWQCELVANVVAPGGVLHDGTSRWHGYHHYLGVSSFAERVVVPRSGAVKIRDDAPLDVVAVVGCAVATGVGAVQNTAQVPAGASVAVIGCGGVGLSVIQGARLAGAARIVACDTNPAKHEVARRVGATEVVGDAGRAERPRLRLRRDRPDRDDRAAIAALGLGGAAVVVGLPPTGRTARFDPLVLAESNQRILGSNYGSVDPQRDIPRLIDLYMDGELDLDALVSGRRPLDEAAEALDDLAAGRTLRTLLINDDGQTMSTSAELITPRHAEPEVRFKRVLGLPALVFFGLAYMVPLTVWTTYGIVTTSTEGHLPLAYLVTTIAMGLTAWSYGRMVIAQPVAGSAYTYASRAFGRPLGFMVGWALMLDYIFLPMINYLLIGLYMQDYFPSTPQALWVILAVALVTGLNILGIKLLAGMNLVFVAAQFVFVAVFAAMAIGDIPDDASFTAPFYDSGTDLGLVFAGAAVLALSFLGFDAVSTLSEETEDPRRKIPLAIMLCALIGGGVYIFQSYLGAPRVPGLRVFADHQDVGERRRHDGDRRRLPQQLLHRRLRGGLLRLRDGEPGQRLADPVRDGPRREPAEAGVRAPAPALPDAGGGERRRRRVRPDRAVHQPRARSRR